MNKEEVDVNMTYWGKCCLQFVVMDRFIIIYV